MNLTVLDVNDHRPTFSVPNYELEVSENVSPGATIHTLQVVDKDATKRHFIFQLENTAHVSSEQKFQIESSSGDIILKDFLDR